MSKPINKIKDRLRDALIIRDMKPIELSEKTGIPKSAISQYMSGYTKPKDDRTYLICKALDINEAWLMGYDVPMERSSMVQSDESPILKAIYNSELKDSKIAQEFVMKKLSDRIQFEPEDFTLLLEFKKLNAEGKKEAINRISELTYVPKYTDDFSKIGFVAENSTEYITKKNNDMK
jgi:transcriptional regulator with XRE-family HTH domain